MRERKRDNIAMRLSQEAIQRMISGRSGGGVGGGSFDPSALAGYATQAWTEENYISKTFFNELFVVHKKVTTVVMDGETEISRTVTTNTVFAPNEIPGTTTETDEETGYVTTVTTEISSIESKKGFWTNYFLSALGLNSEGGGGGLTLNEPLATINVSGLAAHPSSSGQTIVWNGSAWVYGTAGGTGTVTGVKVGDVTYSPVNGIVSIPAYPTSMAWSAITGKPTTLAGYGITDAKIENGVITLGSNTITPLTSSAITDMATKTWVGQQGFALASNVYSKTDADAKFMTIAAFENLFNALNSSDQKVSHPYSSGVASIKAMVGLWTEQYLSALGKSDSGGEIVLNEPLASINDAGLAAHPSSSGQTILWNGSTWTYGTAGGGSGSVTSVGMTVPTGFVVSGSPVTSSGTLGISFASGYSLPTTSKQSNWDTAYGWGNHALAGYATQTWVGQQGFALASSLNNYLPLTGGTLTGALTVNGTDHQNLIVGSSAVSGGVAWTGIQFNHTVNDSNVMYGGIRMDEQDGSFYRYNHSYTTYKIWDEGTDGAGSGLDADLLDGHHASYFAPLSELNNYVTLATNQTISGVKTFTPQQIFTNGIKIGQYEIVPDPQNGGLHIKGGVYADTYVSALGISDTGSQVVLNALLESLNNSGLGAHGSSNTTVVWNGSAWTFGTTGLDQTALVNYLATNGYITQTTADGRYLKLTGGTLTGVLMIKGSDHQNLIVNSSAVSGNVAWTGIQFDHVDNESNVMYGGIKMNEQDGSFYRYDHNYAQYKIWDAGSDGANSGLDADLLDGQHGSYYGKASDITTLQGYFTNGVANSAARLSGTSSYTAWGRTYWSSGVPQNVSGNIDLNKGEDIRLKDGSNYYRIFGVSSSDNTLLIGWELKSITNSNTTLCAGNNLNIGYGSNVGDTTYGKYWSIFRNNGHLTINADDSSDVFLNVGGATKTTRLYLYKPNAANDTNAVYLEYNTNNAGIHLVGGGFYADTYVSALGLSDSGGSAFDEAAMWQALGTTITAKNIALAYIQTAADTRYALKNDILTMNTLSWSYGSVTSATGNSYNGSAARSFVIPKNTSHLTNDSGFITSSALGAYLPLTGGTLSLPGIGYLTIKNTASDYPLIRFEGKTAGGLGFIGVNAQKLPVFVTVDNNGGYTEGVSQWHALLHTGNTYVTNGKGYINGTEITAISGNAATASRLAGNTAKSAWGQTYWSNGQPQDISGNMTSVGNITPSSSGTYNIGTRSNYYNGVYCGYFNLIDSTTNEDFNITWYNVDGKRVLAMYNYETIVSDMILGSTSSSYGLYYNGTTGRWGIGTSEPSYKLDVNGVTRATRLISNSSDGDSLWLISSSTYNCIRFDLGTTFKWSFGCNANYFYWYGGTAGYALSLLNNGNFGIGTNNPSYKLDVAGDMGCSGVLFKLQGLELNSTGALSNFGGYIDFHYNGGGSDYTSRIIEDASGRIYLNAPNGIRIGNAVLMYDSGNNALKVQHYQNGVANFYATGGVSALGMSAGTSGMINANLLPETTNAYTLGDSSHRFSYLYANNVNTNNLSVGGQLSLSYATSSGGGTSTIYAGSSANGFIIKGDASTTLQAGSSLLLQAYASSTAKSTITLTTSAITANRQITVNSDMRLKDVYGAAEAELEDIARTPIFNFKWRDLGDADTIHLGTAADYIQRLFPSAVTRTEDGILALDYSATALASAVITARTVMTHEERIAALEKENQLLRNEIETLKAA